VAGLLHPENTKMKQRRNGKKRIRSVWGTTPILSINRTSKADKLLGIDSDTLVFATYYTTNEFTRNFSKYCRNKVMKGLVRVAVFLWALRRYDIFHYFCDRGILPTWHRWGINPLELPLLKLLGKKVFVYTSGTDVRTRKTTLSLGSYNCCIHCPHIGTACICDEEKHKRNLSYIGKYADELLSMGDMTEYVPESNKDLYFFPVDVNEIRYIGAHWENRGFVRIIHAPNHRHYKGTDYLIQAVERLKAKGYALDLMIVEGVSNQNVLEMCAQGDIVADQFLIGGHGIFAVEAMALGKPVICYVRKREYLLKPEECPIISANPTDLEKVLEELISNPVKRTELGERGRKYVEKYFSIEAFSGRLGDLYRKHGVLGSN
jgi:glycosyltransferase involved in cell wall biosynthesis